MAPPVDRSLLDEAVELVRRAGALTLEHFQHHALAVDRKGDGTPVTVADRRAERFLREELAVRHPGDGIIGEEEGVLEGTTGRTWVIDPIDGTKAFTRGVPLYTNLLAVTDEHGPAVGVINVPALDETVAAGRGLGCTWDGTPCRVSERTALDDAYLTTSAFEHWPEGALLEVKRAGLHLRTWGDGYGYVLVATGRAEAMVDPEAAYWDLAPLPVILAEAGGRFTDWSGAETAEGGSGLATNGALHDRILGLLAQ